MPVPGNEHTADLSGRIMRARRRMADSVSAAARLTPERVLTWGQFADAPARSHQTGIYGTSTAAAMLAARGMDVTSTVCLLPGVTEPSALDFDVSDLLITYKASAVVDALCAVRYGRTHETRACRSLLSGIIDGTGWGHHTVPGELEGPTVLATAHALSALSGVEGIDTKLLEGPADWLGSQVLNNRSLGPLQLAFAMIALARLRRAGTGPERPDVMRRGGKALRRWLRHAGTERVVYEQIHYWVPKPGEQRNHYLTYPVQVVVGTALAMSGPGVRSRSLLHGLATRLCHAAEADGGLRSTLTERIGIVDAGMVDRFFGEYLAFEPASAGLRRAVQRVARPPWLHREPASLTGLPGSMLPGSMASSRWDRY